MDDIRERMCNNYCGFGVKFGAGKDIACKHCPLNELPKWIPVTERLPNDERLVLVSCHYSSKLEDFVIPARYAGNPRDYNAIKQQYDIEWDEDDRWLTEGYMHFYGKQVVAWQYLPAPYVEPTDEPSASELRGEEYWADQGE